MDKDLSIQELRDNEKVKSEKRNHEPSTRGRNKKVNLKKSVTDRLKNMIPRMEYGWKCYVELKDIPVGERGKYIQYHRDIFYVPHFFTALPISEMRQCLDEHIEMLEKIESRTAEPREADKLLRRWERRGHEAWMERLERVGRVYRYVSHWEKIEE